MNWLLLKNSLLVAGLTTLLAVSFGFLAALWLAGLKALAASPAGRGGDGARLAAVSW